MKKVLSVLFIAILAIALTACGKETAAPAKDGATPAPNTATPAPQNEELTIKHKLGELTIKKNPQKIVVFDFGTLDTLDKLGVDVIGLPKSNIPAYLSKYNDAKYENVGTLKEPDFEKVNALKPDLIVISGRAAPAYEELNKIAPTLYVELDTKNYMESFKNNANLFGQMFGKEDVVTKELAAVDDSVKALNEKAKADGKKALILLTNDGKMSGYGPGSRFGVIHDVFGFAAVDEKIEESTHGAGVTYEYVAEKNPDYIFVVDRTAAVDGKSSAKDIIETDLVKKTNAFKNGHIVYLNADYWYLSGGGLLSMPEMINEVANGLK